MKYLAAFAMAAALAFPAMAAEEPEELAPLTLDEEVIDRLEEFFRGEGFVTDRQPNRLLIRPSEKDEQFQAFALATVSTINNPSAACLSRFAAANTFQEGFAVKRVFCQRPNYNATPGNSLNRVQMDFYDGARYDGTFTFGMRCDFMEYVNFPIFDQLCGSALPEL
ncbi:MAG: hypothetical protein AAFR17_15115 [Pseudomonadota bacterium]